METNYHALNNLKFIICIVSQKLSSKKQKTNKQNKQTKNKNKNNNNEILNRVWIKEIYAKTV